MTWRAAAKLGRAFAAALAVGALLAAAGHLGAPGHGPREAFTRAAAAHGQEPVAFAPSVLVAQALARGAWSAADARALRRGLEKATREERAEVLSRLTTALNDGHVRLDSPRLF